MKHKICFTIVIVAAISIQPGFAQDTAQFKPSRFLISYYQIKDALVAGNAATGMSTAKELVTLAKGADKKGIPESSLDALVKDAGSISKTKDLKRQRDYFADLSANMLALAKAVNLSDKPVYQQYCPMKKASWLSTVKAIKNPYYGSAMLTCGEVVETVSN